MGVGVGVSGIGEIRFAGSFFGRGLKYSVIFFRLGFFLEVCFFKFFFALRIRSSRMLFRLLPVTGVLAFLGSSSRVRLA